MKRCVPLVSPCRRAGFVEEDLPLPPFSPSRSIKRFVDEQTLHSRSRCRQRLLLSTRPLFLFQCVQHDDGRLLHARRREFFILAASLRLACVCSPLGAAFSSYVLAHLLRGQRRGPSIVDRSAVRGVSRSGEGSLRVMHNREMIDSRENCRKMIARLAISLPSGRADVIHGESRESVTCGAEPLPPRFGKFNSRTVIL